MLPVTLGSDSLEQVLPAEVIAQARKLSTFIVENEKTARRFLSLFKTDKPVRELTLHLLNEHTSDAELPACSSPCWLVKM